MSTIIATAYGLPTSLVSNGATTGNPWSTPNNLFLVDGDVAVSNPGAGVASDVIVGNYVFANPDGTFGIPNNAVITGLEFELIGYKGAQTSPVLSLTIYLVDNTSGTDVFYPYTAPFTGLTQTLATYGRSRS